MCPPDDRDLLELDELPEVLARLLICPLNDRDHLELEELPELLVRLLMCPPDDRDRLELEELLARLLMVGCTRGVGRNSKCRSGQ